MWFPLTLLLLAGVAVATIEHEHAWETGNEYRYLVNSRMVTGLDNLKEQYTGLQFKGLLILQVKSPERLLAKLSNPQYAHIHRELVDGPETELSEQMLEYHQQGISEKPFEIKLKHGVIRDLLVDSDVPTWQLNILKAIVGQLQIDTQGENVIRSKSIQIPQDDSSSVMFKAMEDSVGGNCEVLYEISPLFDNSLLENPDKIPFPELRGEGRHYDVKKVKNYERCQHRQLYHYGFYYDPLKSGKYNRQSEIPMQLSTTQLIISGNLKRFTIQSTVMKNQVSVKSEKSDSFLGTVYSIMRLTLVKKNKSFSPMLESQELSNLESTGNLVYTYNNPFSKSEERRTYRPNISQNSAEVQCCSSESKSSPQDSQSSESSSSSNRLQVSMLQPTAALHLPPNLPLLPYFVGYNGKTIQMSEEVNVLERAQSIISQIADELQTPNEITSQSTLEKFIILKNLLRTMSRQQYIELEKLVLGNKGGRYSSSLDKLRQNVWSTYRDAVSQAGTGPALLTIEHWLKSGKVEGLEAARLLSTIPKNVNAPTAEYVNKYFEILLDPVVSQQENVNTPAILAFAQLIRNSYIGMKYYPLYSVDLMTSENHKAIVERYIPYLAKQLKEGFSENNSRKIQTYIIALGVTGHEKILPVFEPYLEGQQPTTKFQRMLMVASLYTLAKYQPTLVGPVFYKLYLNKNEAHEVRCIAVHQLLISDPPMLMLQRIAKYTNYDTSEQVNSVVRTTMNSIVNTKRPEWRNLANKVRSVRNLLTTKVYNGQSSMGYYKDLENWIVTGVSLQTVVSDNSQVPMYLHFGLNTILDSLGQPTVQGGYAVSNIKQLIETFIKYYTGNKANEEVSQRSRVDELAQTLNIHSEHVEQLEGNINIDSIYGFLYYPFNEQTIQNAALLTRQLLKQKRILDSTVFSNREISFVLPTENGIPFIFSQDVPMLIKLEAEINKGTVSSGNKYRGLLNTVLAGSVQKRFGFLALFEHQNYLAGIDHNEMLQIPAEFEVELDTKQRKLAIKIDPILSQTQQDSQYKLLHYSTVPFTTRQNILELKPLSLDRNTHHVLNSRKQKVTLEKGAISIKLETDNKEMEENNLQLEDYTQLLKLNQFNRLYKKVDVLLNTENLRSGGLRLNLNYDNMEIHTTNEEQASELGEQNMLEVGSEPNSRERREQIMRGLSKHVQSGNVYVVDISYNIPTSEELQVLTIGAMSSNVNRKSKLLVYWNSQLPNMKEPDYEIIYSQEIQSSLNTPLDFEYELKNAPRDEFKAELQYGKRYNSGNRFVAVGTATRSNQLNEIIENSKLTKQCLRDVSEGNKALRSCQQATEIAQIRDQLNLSIRVPESIKKIFNSVYDYLSKYLPTYIEVTSPRNSKTNTIDVKMIMSPVDVSPTKHYLSTSQMDLSVYNPLEKVLGIGQRLFQQTNTIFEGVLEKNTFTLDKNMAVTFDKLVYPVTLGPCNYVLLTTYPQNRDSRQNEIIPEMSKVAVLARDADDGSRIVTMIIGNQEVQLMKSGNSVECVVDGQTVEVSQSRNYQEQEGGQIVFEIVRLPDGSIKIDSYKYGISVVYDGVRVQISASNRYRNAIRGLAGNYDSQRDNDFVTPKNCILMKPEEFTATYALTEENCQGPAMKNKLKAEQASCIPLNHRQSNVISDREAGRLLTENENWGYHQDKLQRLNVRNRYQGLQHEGRDNLSEKHNIVYRTRVFEEGQEICFTTRPVSMCREGTIPVAGKPRKYQLYCEPRNDESLATKRRIENGANPDFTRKPVSKSHLFQIPLTCNAA